MRRKKHTGRLTPLAEAQVPFENGPSPHMVADSIGPDRRAIRREYGDGDQNGRE